MIIKNELINNLAIFIEQSDEARDGTFSCGLASVEKDLYREYCTPDLGCEACPFWINPEMETICDTLLEYVK